MHRRHPRGLLGCLVNEGGHRGASVRVVGRRAGAGLGALGTGRSLRAVARAIGCREQQLRRYVWSVGGRRPAPSRRAQVCLSAGEREEISRGLARGDSCRQIAATPPISAVVHNGYGDDAALLVAGLGGAGWLAQDLGCESNGGGRGCSSRRRRQRRPIPGRSVSSGSTRPGMRTTRIMD